MLIESIQICNYRVFRSVEVKGLGQLAVFVGANGSGKSTFFDGFFKWFGMERSGLLRFVCSDTWKPYLEAIAGRAFMRWPPGRLTCGSAARRLASGPVVRVAGSSPSSMNLTARLSCPVPPRSTVME